MKIMRIGAVTPSYDSLLQGFKNTLELNQKSFFTEEQALQALMMSYAPQLVRRLNEILDKREKRDVSWDEVIAELNRMIRSSPQEKARMFEYLRVRIKPAELEHYIHMANAVVPFSKDAKKKKSPKYEHSPKEHGFIDECIGKNKDADDPGAYCASIVDKVKGTTKWREKD